MMAILLYCAHCGQATVWEGGEVEPCLCGGSVFYSETDLKFPFALTINDKNFLHRVGIKADEDT